MSKLLLVILLSFQALADGKSTYESRCAKCHGIKGNGDGPSAELLAVPPAVLSNPKLYIDREGLNMSPDERISKVIREGGASVGKSKLMQAFPEFSDTEVASLLSYIKTLAKGSK
jgi:mono/diheme cytochrome c family protein